MWGRVIIRKIGPDDYVMLFALLLFLILAGFATYCELQYSHTRDPRC